MTKSKDAANEAELARTYQESHDLSGFEGEGEPVEVRRNLTISVRFDALEIGRCTGSRGRRSEVDRVHPPPPRSRPVRRWTGSDCRTP